MTNIIDVNNISNIKKKTDKPLSAEVIQTINEINSLISVELLNLYCEIAKPDKGKILFLAKLFIIYHTQYLSKNNQLIGYNNSLDLFPSGDDLKKMLNLLLIIQPIDNIEQYALHMFCNTKMLIEVIKKEKQGCGILSKRLSINHTSIHDEAIKAVNEIQALMQNKFIHNDYRFSLFKQSNNSKEIASYLLKLLEDHDIHRWIYDALLTIKSGGSGIFSPENDLVIVQGAYDKQKQLILSQFAETLPKIIALIQDGNVDKAQKNFLTQINKFLESSEILGLNVINILFKTKYKYDRENYQSLIKYIKDHDTLKELLKGDFGRLILLMIGFDNDQLSFEVLQNSFSQNKPDELITKFLSNNLVQDRLKNSIDVLKYFDMKSNINTLFSIVKGLMNSNKTALSSIVNEYNDLLKKEQINNAFKDYKNNKASLEVQKLSQRIGIEKSKLMQNDKLIESILKHCPSESTINQIKLTFGIIPQSLFKKYLGDSYTQKDILNFLQNFIGKLPNGYSIEGGVLFVL